MVMMKKSAEEKESGERKRKAEGERTSEESSRRATDREREEEGRPDLVQYSMLKKRGLISIE